VAWPEIRTPWFELRGDAVAEPPVIDIGADILHVERRPAEPARITICRQSPQDAGYREVFVSIDGERVAMLEYGATYTAEIFGLLFMLGAFPLYLPLNSLLTTPLNPAQPDHLEFGQGAGADGVRRPSRKVRHRRLGRIERAGLRRHVW
jgi:hypothetical protein